MYVKRRWKGEGRAREGRGKTSSANAVAERKEDTHTRPRLVRRRKGRGGRAVEEGPWRKGGRTVEDVPWVQPRRGFVGKERFPKAIYSRLAPCNSL
jgi:hypothetical protein